MFLSLVELFFLSSVLGPLLFLKLSISRIATLSRTVSNFERFLFFLFPPSFLEVLVSLGQLIFDLLVDPQVGAEVRRLLRIDRVVVVYVARVLNWELDVGDFLKLNVVFFDLFFKLMNFLL